MSDDKAKALDKAHDRFSKAKKNELPKEDAYFKALHVLREKEEALRAHPTDARRRARDEAEASCNKAQAEYDALFARNRTYFESKWGQWQAPVFRPEMRPK